MRGGIDEERLEIGKQREVKNQKMKQYVQDFKDTRERAAIRRKQKIEELSKVSETIAEKRDVLEEKKVKLVTEIADFEAENATLRAEAQANADKAILPELDAPQPEAKASTQSPNNTSAKLDAQKDSDIFGYGKLTIDETTDPEEIREWELLCKKNELTL
jgi:hypothetical protein